MRALEPEQVAMVEILRSPPAITSPEFKVEVAPVLVWRIFPPETVRPEAEESPPEVKIASPPEKVEVPVPPTRIVEEAWKSPWTWKFEETVEEAWEINPDWKVASPPIAAVPEAVKVDAELREPETKREEPKVEEAVAKSPPPGVREKIVEEEMFWTMSGDPVCPASMRKVRMFDWVEVAPIVRTEETSAVLVPIATLSVKVWGLTRVPSSWNPETLEAEMPVH